MFGTVPGALEIQIIRDMLSDPKASILVDNDGGGYSLDTDMHGAAIPWKRVNEVLPLETLEAVARFLHEGNAVPGWSLYNRK